MKRNWQQHGNNSASCTTRYFDSYWCHGSRYSEGKGCLDVVTGQASQVRPLWQGHSLRLSSYVDKQVHLLHASMHGMRTPAALIKLPRKQ